MASFVLHLRVTEASVLTVVEQVMIIVETGAVRASATSIHVRLVGDETAPGCTVAVAVEAVLLEGPKGRVKA